MKRNVVIAGHDYPRLWQRIEERTRLLELIRTCALCKVARDRDEIRLNFSDDSYQRIEQQRIHAPEMQVRKMNYGSHVNHFLRVQSRATSAAERGTRVEAPSP